MPSAMDAISTKSEMYHPSAEVIAQANVPDYLELREQAIADPVPFWDARAKELLDWYEPYQQVLDTSTAPFFKWFVGGKTNIAHNALDRHVKSAHKNKLAIIWEGEDGEQRVYSYFKLWKEVNRFANVLKSMGVKRGDTVTIYMGRVVELPIAMLATAKIGAIHSVVYGGFSEQALADRITDAKSKIVVTCDGAWLRGKTVNLKDITDEAVNRSPIVQKVIVYKRTGPAGQHAPGPRLLVARADGAADRQPGLRDRADGCRGPALHPLHLGHDRQAQGPAAHLRRLPGAHCHDAQVCLRHQGRRPLLVRGRPGLDHRPLLHRLCAAHPGCDLLYLRGRAGLPAARPLVAADREVQHLDPLHGADGHPLVYAFWRGLDDAPRPLVAAAAGLGGRADQPRGVALVLQEHRPRDAAR